MNTGLKKEIEKNYLGAVEDYEMEINNSEASLECYINLAFIYWSLAFEFFEFSLPNNIPDEMSIIGGNRYPIILELGLKKFPHSIELEFWQKYFANIIFGEGFTINECQTIINKNNKDKSNIPYFLLYLFNKEKYREKMVELMEEIIKYPTVKNLYIKSIIGRDFS